MNPAILSLIALAIVILVSCVSRLNVGVLAMAMAWLVGIACGIRAEQVAAGFPGPLFVTLAGVTLFFSMAQANGTLERVAQSALLLCRGNRGAVPIMFFFSGAVLASIGPGNIATAALMAPIAMPVAIRAGVPVFLMALMVGNGANSGSLSPFAPTGVIAAGLLQRGGLAGMEWRLFIWNLVAHALVAFAGYFLFGGWRLFRGGAAGDQAPVPPFERRHWITLGVMAALIAAVVFARVHTGLAAFAASTLLALLGAANIEDGIKRCPWGVLVMVCGVTVLIALLEKNGAMELFTGWLASMSTRDSVTAVMAFLTGLISTYASTSGVILPAFLPTVPQLAQRVGADPHAIALSIGVGAHLVDVSPLSTIGALCIASLPAGEDSRALFHRLLAWGFSMVLVGPVLCWLFFR